MGSGLKMPKQISRRFLVRVSAGVGIGLMLSQMAGCGFTLRRPLVLQFESISFKGFGAHSPIAQMLHREIDRQPQTKLLEANAQVVLECLNEAREQVTAASTATGQVREITLRLRFKFRVLRRDTGDMMAPETELVLERPLSYEESVALAKEREAEMLFLDMVNDIARQVMQRLAALKTL
jgi:LPS-assembly lipoprotein